MDKRFHIFATPAATATGAPPEESYIGVRNGISTFEIEARLGNASFGAFTYRAFPVWSAR